MRRWQRGELVQTLYNDGLKGTLLYGIVVRAGEKKFTVRWESGISNTIDQWSHHGLSEAHGDAEYLAELRARLSKKPRMMVMMCDDNEIPRAWGIASTVEAARAEAVRQLHLYVAKKKALGEPLSEGDFREQIAPVKS